MADRTDFERDSLPYWREHAPAYADVLEREDTVERAYDWFGYSTFGSAYVAKCSHCASVCAYWDDDDLVDGKLLHDCNPS